MAVSLNEASVPRASSQPLTNAPFLSNLWLLCQSAAGGHGVIKWSPAGTEIVISTHEEVESVLMPQLCYPKAKNTYQFSAFQRQLNHFGFRKVAGIRRGVYRNDHFRRDRPDLLSKIVCRRTKSCGGNQPTSAMKRSASAKRPRHSPIQHQRRLQTSENGPLPLSHQPVSRAQLVSVGSAAAAYPCPATTVGGWSQPAGCVAPGALMLAGQLVRADGVAEQCQQQGGLANQYQPQQYSGIGQ